MKRRRSWWLAPAVPLIVLGCVDYDEALTLNRDGSGRVEMRMAVDKEAYETMQQLGAGIGPEDAGAGGLDRARIEEALASRNSKAKIERYSEREEGGDRVWDLAFSFESVEDLADIGDALSETDDESAPPFLFEKQPDGTWLYRREMETDGTAFTGAGTGGEAIDIPGVGAVDPAEFDPAELQAKMEEMMASLQDLQARVEEEQARMEEQSATRRVRFSVTFPGRVIESNATEVNGSTAIWRYGFDELRKMEGSIPAFTARVE